MNIPAFALAFFGAASLLLSSCNSNQPVQTNATSTTDAPATHDMAGMDHAKMAGASPMLTAMNEMMTKMDAVKMQGNTDLDFARMMLEHHRGAVVMADLELRDGQDPTMRQMAAAIKADQQHEISELEAVAQRLSSAPANYRPQDPADAFTSQLKASMSGMMNQMPAPAADPDLNFNQLMAVHHQSAVDMALAEVAHGQDAQLKKLAQQIITAQRREIQQFKTWQATHSDKSNASGAVYECPMGHPGSQSPRPGKCPTCKMELVKKA